MLFNGRSTSTSSSYYESLVMYFFLIATTLVCLASVVKGQSSASLSSAEDLSSDSASWYSIEGRIIQPDKKSMQQFQLQTSSGSSSSSADWNAHVQILVNGGENVAYVHEDGSFTIHGLQSGSHVIDVIHPQFHYESARIDITSKGKIRARKVNHLQPAQVTHMTYPLRLTPIGPYRYFQQREQWRATDVLFSPMVLMMILPLVLIVILPKMMSDPETKKEMESMTLPKYEMPEMSEMLTSFFGGGGASSTNNHKDENGDRRKAIRGKKSN